MKTPNGKPEEHDRCGRLGAVCLAKPVSQSALFDAVAKVLRVEGIAERSAGDGAAVPAAVPARILRVLLAEDTPGNQKLVLLVLGKRGHRVAVAENGQEAVEMLRHQDFDVVLMDVQMPVMDGFQATAAVRKLPEATKARVPIVAMTAHALKGDDQRCLAAGMDAYLSKPIHAETLIALVERLAGGEPPPGGGHEGNRTPTPPEPLSAPAAPAAAVIFDPQEAVQRCFGNREVFREMVEFFHAEAPELLDKMHTALDGADGTAAAHAAHRLCGTLLYLGSRETLQAAQRIEEAGMSGELAAAGDALQLLERRVEQLKQALASHDRDAHA